MKIRNLAVMGLETSIIRSGFPHKIGEPSIEKSELIELENLSKVEYVNSNKHLKRAKNLSSCEVGQGHDNFLIGITVQFDLQYSQYWTKHLQRYHWFQYFSGQSMMHKLTSSEDVKLQCNEFVLNSAITELNSLIDKYNNITTYPIEYQDLTNVTHTINSKEDLFHIIMSNCPMGYMLWVPITTNYMQLKTMYNQRKTHRLYDWKKFCNWIETLPMSYLITGK